MTGRAAEEIASTRWAGEMGDTWNEYFHRFEGMLAPVGQAVIDHAAFRPGEKVLDVGCGAGVTSFEISELVGSGGQVTGLDLNKQLIETCKKRALGFNNVDFIAADAAQVSLPAYDCLFSRFGLMFFDEPYAAFKNLFTLVRPGGRMVFCCWCSPKENPWVAELMSVAAKYVELPTPVPRAPGPFAFADPDYVKDILHSAGFSHIELEVWEGDQYLGGLEASPEEAAAFAMDALFIGDALRDESEEIRTMAYHDLVELLKPKVREGRVILPAKSWLVKAERP